jgi:hypothetical protein
MKWRRVVRLDSAQTMPGSMMRRRVMPETRAKSVPAGQHAIAAL